MANTQVEALKLALEALTNAYWPTDSDLLPAHNIKECAEAITAIKAILSPQNELEAHWNEMRASFGARQAALETKDEPVGWAEHGVINWLADKQFNHTSFLYATPSQRTWVGLMDEEIDVIYEQHHNQYGECESVGLGYERAIEAKLKEKNT